MTLVTERTKRLWTSAAIEGMPDAIKAIKTRQRITGEQATLDQAERLSSGHIISQLKSPDSGFDRIFAVEGLPDCQEEEKAGILLFRQLRKYQGIQEVTSFSTEGKLLDGFKADELDALYPTWRQRNPWKYPFVVGLLDLNQAGGAQVKGDVVELGGCRYSKLPVGLAVMFLVRALDRIIPEDAGGQQRVGIASTGNNLWWFSSRFTFGGTRELGLMTPIVEDSTAKMYTLVSYPSVEAMTSMGYLGSTTI
jgi:hypothetical protein